MPTARKLPSGNYRCRVSYNIKDENGKTVYKTKSFTAATKREAERLAVDWELNRLDTNNLNVGQAVSEYINSKETVLSPATVRGYRSVLRNQFKPIEFVKISRLEALEIQYWIKGLSKQLSPKSVKNACGLLSATCKFYGADMPTVTLPKPKKTTYYIPSDEEIRKMTKNSHGDLYRCVLLGTLGLRLSEMCALTSDDLDGVVLNIDKAKVRAEGGEYIIKSTKTLASTRKIGIPEFIADELRKKKGNMIDISPRQLQSNFEKLRNKLKLNHFTIHSLRHWFASNAFYNGATKNFVEEYGGWSHGSKVLNEIYTNIIKEKHDKQAEIIAASMEFLHKKNSTPN